MLCIRVARLFFLLLFAASILFYVINVVQAQEVCIFGDADDCHMPCRCSPPLPGLDVDRCNRTTGFCHSLSCETGYTLQTIVNRYAVCQPPKTLFSPGLETQDVYLVHPQTKERLHGRRLGGRLGGFVPPPHAGQRSTIWNQIP